MTNPVSNEYLNSCLYYRHGIRDRSRPIMLFEFRSYSNGVRYWGHDSIRLTLTLARELEEPT